jgi:hypothetical protein
MARLIARATGEQSRPVRHGYIVEIYTTGLGAVSNPALAGADVLYSGALSGRRLSSEREKFPGLVDNAPL